MVDSNFIVFGPFRHYLCSPHITIDLYNSGNVVVSRVAKLFLITPNTEFAFLTMPVKLK